MPIDGVEAAAALGEHLRELDLPVEGDVPGVRRREEAGVERAARDLIAAEADEGVAVAEGVVDERQRLIARGADEPEREAGEVDGERVPVDAVEATPGDEAAGVEERLLVRGQGGGPLPGADEVPRDPAARLDEEGSGAHRGIADREREDLVRGHAVAQERAQRPLDDDLRDRPRGVVRAEPPALLARPEGRSLELHEPLVHGPHVLHVELAVGHGPAVDHEEPIQHAEHGAVRDPWRAALQEGVAVRLEEAALAEQAEERDDPRPCAVATVDRAAVARLVAAELVVEAAQRARGREREEAPRLGEEHEDHPQDDRHEAGVDRVLVPAEEPAPGHAVGALEAVEELAEGREGLRAKGLRWGGPALVEEHGRGGSRRGPGECKGRGRGDRPVPFR